MGFFSWKTSDTNRSISNVHSGRGTFKVTMLMPYGEKYVESDYEGYGIFGGMDFYDAVYELTKTIRYLNTSHLNNGRIDSKV